MYHRLYSLARLFALSLLVVLIFTEHLSAQMAGPLPPENRDTKGESAPEGTPDAFIRSMRVNVNLVVVPVRVADTKNRPVLTLGLKNFALYENDRQQNIEYFAVQDSPLSIGLVLDLSKSMLNKIEMERTAVSDFFKNANSQDDYFVVTISDRPKLLTDSTQSLGMIQSNLAMEKPDGKTALLDGVSLAMTHMQSAQYRRRALLVISDGGDNHSHHGLKEIKRIVQDSDVDVYAIGILDNSVFKSFEESMGRKWLSEITDVTGGHTIAINDVSKLPAVAATISREMRDQYVLGYRPLASLTDHDRRTIKVEVTAASDLPLHAYYRSGYAVDGERVRQYK